MLTKGKFLISFEVPGHTKEYTEGFTEEMVIPYRTEELRPYLRYPNQEINNHHLHSEHIRLQIREILQIPLSDITIIDIISTTMNILYILLRGILSLITILSLIRNEKIYQAHKHTHPTNKIRYIISQLIILTLYTSSLILVSYTYRIILRYI